MYRSAFLYHSKQLILSLVFSLYCILASHKSVATPNCADIISRNSEPTSFYQSLDIPSEVIRFLESNPAYTNYLTGMGYGSRTHAYFSGRVYKDWILIKDFLQDFDSPSVLDIGSGIGGIDILIARNHPKAQLTLIDKVEKGGFNIIQMAKDLIMRNSKAVKIQTFEPGAPEVTRENYDIITSFRGLGYLFPYDVYRSSIISSLNMGGVLILDLSVRDMELETSDVVVSRFGGKSSGSEYDKVIQDLRETIGEPVVISQNHSYHRVVVRRTIPRPLASD